MSKSGKARNIPISAKAMELLQGLPRWKGCPYVVPNPDTSLFGNLYCAWDTARKRAGLPDVRMHDLWHSFASNLVNAGQSIYVVGKLPVFPGQDDATLCALVRCHIARSSGCSSQCRCRRGTEKPWSQRVAEKIAWAFPTTPSAKTIAGLGWAVGTAMLPSKKQR